MLDLHSAIYVWKGRGATLDARNVGLQLGVLTLLASLVRQYKY